MRRIVALPLACLALAVSACGFQLQGVSSFPPELAKVYLAVPDPNSDLAVQLLRSLASAGVALTQDASVGTATLRIVDERYGRRVKSVSAQNRPTEYEVFYVAQFELEGTAGTLLAPQRVSRSRVFPYNERDILGKQQEEEMLREALARDIAGLITRQLAGLDP
jgi:LPS-assembly lipoprotein